LKSLFSFLSCLVVVLLDFSMVKDSSETTPAILARLFKDPDAPLGTKWLKVVKTGWSNDTLHRQVVKTGTLSAVRTRELYGHLRTQTQMHGIPGPYWMTNPLDMVKEEAKRLNMTIDDPQKRLDHLRTDTI
jgi:hypothetical protein